ncbi:DNA replication and repair protein RecF [Leucothrix sargassi]|nr:DNA replication and repair protein RecF [Leucothrix sargassi]
MLLKQLSIAHCRIIENANLEFSPQVNLICGDNGSGKSSILEAIAILSRGRSFRTSRITDVISNQHDSLLIRADCVDADNLFRIGIERSKTSTRIRVNQKEVNTQAALSRYLPITIIDPNSVDLLTGSPSVRRSYIDWIAFYLFPEFHSIWQNYQRVLKQRNLCLRAPKYLSALPVWTDELIKSQLQIISYRERSLEVLNPQLASFCDQLLEGHSIQLKLTTGFAQAMDLSVESQKAFYLEKQESDIKSARTLSGAHRADLQVMFNDQIAQHCASRGQLKLIAIAMLLAQSRSIDPENNRKGIIAIDDLAAELDGDNKIRLLTTLRGLEQQLILTSTQAELIPLYDEDHLFHVKQGKVNLNNSSV